VSETNEPDELKERLAAVERQLAHLRCRDAVQSELQMTRSGRLRLTLSKEQRAQLWRICKFVATVALGAAVSRGWVALVPYLQGIAGHP
jgi:hypothetical protein